MTTWLTPWITLAALVLVAILGALAGYLVGHLRAARRITELEAERRAYEQKELDLERTRAQLGETFKALSSDALKHNSEEFLRLASERLSRLQEQHKASLSEKEKSIENLVKPIKETLEKTEKQIRQMEETRKEAYGSLSQYLKAMAETQQQLQSETRNLVQALRRPEVRGQWGEMTLRRLVELAGMVEYCDFYEQEHRSGEDGSLRPDMVVRMPEGREIVVDVKTPLDAYLAATEASDDEARRTALARHARKVRERVKELASKAYWTQFSRAPDFVVLFIPGDQFLTAALDADQALLEDALRQKVILATPTSFIALLRAVAFGWRQQSVAENAEQIRELGEELYRRLATFTEHLGRLGKSLGSSVEHYNKAVGSLERQVLPGARRFTEMGIHPKKEVEQLDPLDKIARSPQADESDQTEAGVDDRDSSQG